MRYGQTNGERSLQEAAKRSMTAAVSGSQDKVVGCEVQIEPHTDDRRRNMLFFFTDQQRVDTVGAYGNNVIKTPNLDRLAAEGTLFSKAFTCTAVCTPARASLLTGMWPHRHTIMANLEARLGYPKDLAEGVVPFSQLLRGLGYNVGLEGKYHAGGIERLEQIGFDGELLNTWGEPLDHAGYVRYLEENELPAFRPRDIVRGTFINGRPGKALAGIYDGPVEGTFTYYLAEKTIARLRQYAADYRRTGKPFYMACHFFGPHMPYYIPERYATMYDPSDVVLPEGFAETFENKPAVVKQYHLHWSTDQFGNEMWRKLIAMYWGYTTMIDEQIGRIMSVVEELGLAETTAVLFSTDHGSFEGSHRLNDKGPAMYDDIYAVPMLARIPWIAQPVRVVNSYVSLLDLTATFVDIAGGDPEALAPGQFDGRSLLPLIRGDAAAEGREEIYAEFHGHHFPYSQRMLRNDRYKLILNPADISELYDLAQDPAELVNRIDDPELFDVRKQLMTKLYNHIEATGDKLGFWMDSMCDIEEESSGYDPASLL
jgi:arylsulfatase A-like enzyme